MKNKAQTLGIVIISGIVILIIGFAIINLLTPEITQFRIDMNCANPSQISDGTKLTCLVGDVTVIYWIWAILSISLGGIISRFI